MAEIFELDDLILSYIIKCYLIDIRVGKYDDIISTSWPIMLQCTF